MTHTFHPFQEYIATGAHSDPDHIKSESALFFQPSAATSSFYHLFGPVQRRELRLVMSTIIITALLILYIRVAMAFVSLDWYLESFATWIFGISAIVFLFCAVIFILWHSSVVLVWNREVEGIKECRCDRSCGI
mmetsp:Transcript_9814/g.36618  ORF Transcript_9814/g.36618 Transcript_9814/m.36618 type:complete len:134 (-) Transcript_9814:348-749(-)